MIKKKHIIIVVVLLVVLEIFRAEYYSLVVKESMVKVIDYIEENHKLDENIIFSLESDNHVTLRYEKISDDTYSITLTKKHIILFFISRDVTLKQKYILSRLK